MKDNRKNAILEIVSQFEVDTQETLQALLLERGFSVTQATVSRDIKQLSLVKIMSESGGYKYSLPPKSGDNTTKSMFESLFSHSVNSLDRAMNTIVIKCHTVWQTLCVRSLMPLITATSSVHLQAMTQFLF